MRFPSFEKFITETTKQMLKEDAVSTNWLMATTSVFGIGIIYKIFSKAFARTIALTLGPFGFLSGAAIGMIGTGALANLFMSRFGDKKSDKIINDQKECLSKAQERYSIIVKSNHTSAKKEELIERLRQDIIAGKDFI